MTQASQREEERIRDVYSRRKFTSQYSWFSESHLFMMQDRERAVLRTLRHQCASDLSNLRVLEIGCGHGSWLVDFLKWGARAENLMGIDLIPDRIAIARQRLPEAVQLEVGSADSLDIPDESCDIVLQSTVLSSVLDKDLRASIARELLRVTNRDGLVLWYDFFVDNPRNPDVRGLKRKEIRSLFPDCELNLTRVTLAPPITRMVVPRSRMAAELLQLVPWLRTHYCGVIRKR